MRQTAPTMLARMLKILLALASKNFGMTLQEMAEEADIHQRVVYRYLDAMKRCGVELEKKWEPDRRGWHVLYRLKTIQGVRLNLMRRRAE